MKIFNWMHKRFHHNNNLKDGFSSNMKKNETLINNIANHQALLKQVALTDMLGGWKDGILTIGTLGYDSLKEHYDMVHDDADDVENFYNAEQEELNPLINNTFEHNFEDVVCENHDDDANKEEEITIRTFKEIVVVTPLICNEIMEEANDVEADQKKRITLADLFLADSDVKIKLHYPAPKVLLEPCEKPNIKQNMDFLLLRRSFLLLRTMHVQLKTSRN
uniref:Protein TILLER ANGLE CONTROL 1 n=1 Tax=Cicer arietinum TaxID=3827 RepID=A0A3Q7YGJ5_CICAR|nr:LOW QUALITY PROTEIN: uncharacterized protein LOC101499002 [Cicer arietinum]